MNKDIIEFSDTLAPFLQVHVGKNHFSRGNFVDNETFITICTTFAEWINENKKQIVQNIMDIHKTTANDTGHNCLVSKWKHFREFNGVGFEVKFDYETIELDLIKNVGLIMNHLYQKNNCSKIGGFESKIGGFAGVPYLSVGVSLSEKRNLKNVTLSFGVNYNISSGERNTFEIYEKKNKSKKSIVKII